MTVLRSMPVNPLTSDRQPTARLFPTGQRGMNLVLLSIMMVICLSMAGLVISFGLLTNSRALYQNATNQAVLAAIASYSKQPSAMNPPEEGAFQRERRIANAVDAARQVLNTNSLLSKSGERGHVAVKGEPANRDTTIGQLEFGSWQLEAPRTCSNTTPCCPNNMSPDPNAYPCFAPFSSTDVRLGTVPVSAARLNVTVKNSLLEKIVAPIGKTFNLGIPAFTNTSIATRVDRCTAILLEASDLSAKDSYQFAQLPNTKVDPSTQRILYPPDPALFAYDIKRLPGYDPSSDLSAQRFDCSALGPNPDPYALYWCNTPTERPRSGPARRFFQPHYIRVATRKGPFQVNRRVEPEPFATYLRATNALVRDMSSDIHEGDQVALYVYGRTILDRIPEQRGGSRPFTNDLAYLAQLTNIYNAPTVRLESRGRGVTVGQLVPGIEPNWLTRGWFSKSFAEQTDDDGPGTNLPLAIRHALNDMLRGCSPFARKNIIVVGSGYFNWTYDSGRTTTEADPVKKQISAFCGYRRTVQRDCRDECREVTLDNGTRGTVCEPVCNDTIIENCDAGPNTYLREESNVVFGDTNDPLNNNNNGLLGDLIRNKITLSALVGGARGEPNFCNRWSEEKQRMLGLNDFMSIFPQQGLTHLTKQNCATDGVFFDTDVRYDVDAVQERGGSGLPAADASRCIEATVGGRAQERCAFDFLGEIENIPSWRNSAPYDEYRYGSYFRRAPAVLATLAYRSGGTFGILYAKPAPGTTAEYGDQDDDSSTPPELSSTFRRQSDHRTQFVNPEDISPGNIGARLSRDTVGLSPVYLVEEGPR